MTDWKKPLNIRYERSPSDPPLNSAELAGLSVTALGGLYAFLDQLLGVEVMFLGAGILVLSIAWHKEAPKWARYLAAFVAAPLVTWIFAGCWSTLGRH